MALFIGLTGALALEWEHFISLFRAAGILLSSSPDYLLWSRDSASVTVVARLAYSSLIRSQVIYQPVWWFDMLWKVRVSLKIKCFMWLVLNHKILAWDLLCKHGYQGPSRCSFCLLEVESTEHIFFHCSLFRGLWTFLCTKWSISWSWTNDNLSDFLSRVANLPSLLLELAFICIWEW